MNNRKKILGEKFREAGSSGKKAHVIARDGQWVIFKEGSDRVLAKYATKKGAIVNAVKILKSGLTDMLVFHKSDGTVEKVQLSE